MDKLKKKVKIIGFDADDTLWMNETYFRDTERKFAELMQKFASEKYVIDQLTEVEVKNIPLYGYGVKGFMLSMMETAVKIAGKQAGSEIIEGVLSLGNNLLEKPVVLLDNVRYVIEKLKNKYPLLLLTKGDLLDQQRKLKKSGLSSCFKHIEIMSDKKEQNYAEIFSLLSIRPDEFMMIGNSIKSDILPVLKLGAWAVHIPYHTTWVHEETSEDPARFNRFYKLDSLKDLLKYIPY